jgi:hypothetical protein
MARLAALAPINKSVPGFGSMRLRRQTDEKKAPRRTAYGRNVRRYCQIAREGAFSRGRTTTARQPIQIGGMTNILLSVTATSPHGWPVSKQAYSACCLTAVAETVRSRRAIRPRSPNDPDHGDRGVDSVSRPSTFGLITGPVEMPTRNWQPLFQSVDLDHGVDDECTEHQANESYQGYQGPHQNSEGSNCRPRNPERFSLVIADLAEQLTHFPVRRRWIYHGDSAFLYVSVPSCNIYVSRKILK